MIEDTRVGKMSHVASLIDRFYRMLNLAQLKLKDIRDSLADDMVNGIRPMVSVVEECNWIELLFFLPKNVYPKIIAKIYKGNSWRFYLTAVNCPVNIKVDKSVKKIFFLNKDEIDNLNENVRNFALYIGNKLKGCIFQYEAYRGWTRITKMRTIGNVDEYWIHSNDAPSIPLAEFLESHFKSLYLDENGDFKKLNASLPTVEKDTFENIVKSLIHEKINFEC